MKMVKLSVEVDEEVHRRLKELAQKDRRSLAAYCAVQLEAIAKAAAT